MVVKLKCKYGKNNPEDIIEVTDKVGKSLIDSASATLSEKPKATSTAAEPKKPAPKKVAPKKAVKEEE